MTGFIDWDTLPLGTKPDDLIARELNVARRKVCAERNKRGIKPFIGRVISQEGLGLRSIYEAMYDAVLHEQGIEHSHEVPVPNTNFKSDFKINDTFIEIAGMLNFNKYKEKYLKKKAAYKQLGINVVWLEIEQLEILFINCNLLIKFRENTGCKLCGYNSIKLVKDICHKCYCKTWIKATDHEIGICGFCQKQFPQYSRDSKFCSRQCYWNSMKLDLPSIDWLESEISATSMSEVAAELGVNYYTLHKKLYRNKKRKRE
ncbi:hypothetical protein GTQ43_04825 [Nostoc sp. KVJ3]|uniref:hypothetical protein n=1 Tax=Nostoc sp. KVJ3 TaxID=457945 RepID=UPI002237DC46|nr:hypothetical protein [Nostoc sp. KVJ3]MCW5313161.1 hypothetical protein [Nostoc sp. KVJ3]